MKKKSLKRIAYIFLSLIVSGCASNSSREDFTQLAQDELSYLDIKKNSQWNDLDHTQSTNYLTDLIQDTQLNDLIQQALTANPSLQKTLLTLQASLWEIKSLHGDRLPSVNAGFSGKKTESSDASYTADLNISWEIDLWNKLAEEEDSSVKSLSSDEATYQASRDTLVANVMKSWLAITAKQHAINIQKKHLALLESNEELIQKRFKNGLGDLEELDESRTSTSQSKSYLVELKEDLTIEKRTLQQYLGSKNTLDLAQNTNYPDVEFSFHGFSGQNLQRRPDLKSAYLAIEAADLNTSVAYKDMLPSINLSATLSETAESPVKALFGSFIWSMLADLTQPLYQGGKLKAAAEVAKLETAQAYQDYRDTLLTAVNEVENTLGQEKVLSLQEKHIRDALNSSKKNLIQYQKKYRNGLIEINDLINVQTTTYDLEAELDDIIYERLSNRIDLGLALGLGVEE